MMEITETTLYPRYLHNSLPSDGFGTIVGVMVEVRENNTIIVDCEEDEKKILTIQVPSTVEATSLKNIKYIEVRGEIKGGDVSMREYTDLKDNFDLKTYNQMVNLASSEFKSIFNYE